MSESEKPFIFIDKTRPEDPQETIERLTDATVSLREEITESINTALLLQESSKSGAETALQRTYIEIGERTVTLHKLERQLLTLTEEKVE